MNPSNRDRHVLDGPCDGLRTSAVVVAALLVAGCAVRAPFRLRVTSAPRELTTGEARTVRGTLTNTGKGDLRFEEGAALRYSLLCRGPSDPPGQWGLGSGSGVVGGVWGGVTHRRPDPADPMFCREFPPKTSTLAPGASMPLEVEVETPRRCAAGEGELDIEFDAPDYGRKCPGIWYGEAGKTTRPVRIVHRLKAAEPATPSASPAVLACGFTTSGGAAVMRLALRNTTRDAWRARVIAWLELWPEADPHWYWWAAARLNEPPGALALGESDLVEIAPGEEWSREISLADLEWEEPGGEAPQRLAQLPAGRYEVNMAIETLGGRSWELRCPAAEVELGAR